MLFSVMAACETPTAETPTRLRVLELYSGIGGTHWALRESGLSFEVVAAADINNVANDVYKYNFQGVKVLQKVIESLTVQDLNKLSPDLITMSPPCQPFTRVGLQKDSADPRTDSFFHLLDLLPRLAKLPRYIFVENVKGFETSSTHQRLVETLTEAQYHMQEFLVTPNQFGVPNSRLRYYLLAKQASLDFNFPAQTGVRQDLPDCALPFLTHRVAASRSEATPPSTHPGSSEKPDTHSRAPVSQSPRQQDEAVCSPEKPDSQVSQSLRQQFEAVCSPVADFLENGSDTDLTPYLLPDKFLKRFWCMDIIKKEARNCCCFTKAYGHHIEGAGSLLQTAEDSTVDLEVYKATRAADQSALEAVRTLRLRFFTPREVANLMCFPPEFKFPDAMTTIQRYRVLGNSLNVHVVSVLLRLLCGDRSA